MQVRDAQGNVLASGTVNPDGTFQIALTPPVNDGSTLQVVLTDAAGNASTPGTVASPDLQAPAQPTGLELASGVTLTGSGEPGATVQVRDTSGTVIGTGVVNPNGSFSITLSPPRPMAKSSTSAWWTPPVIPLRRCNSMPRTSPRLRKSAISWSVPMA